MHVDVVNVAGGANQEIEDEELYACSSKTPVPSRGKEVEVQAMARTLGHS